MPAPALDRLQVQPSLILDWLENNLLMAGTIANVPNPPGLAWVTITQRQPMYPGGPAPVAVNQSGRPMDVFEMRSNGAGAHNSVRAYICNYVPNAIRSVNIGNAGDYVFTTNLNGCTYGVGPAGNDGSRRISHSNRGGNTILQRQDTAGVHGVGGNMGGVKLLEPSEYRRLGDGGSHQATVFGIRTGLNWNFYFQSYTAITGTNFRVNGVFPI